MHPISLVSMNSDLSSTTKISKLFFSFFLHKKERLSAKILIDAIIIVFPQLLIAAVPESLDNIGPARSLNWWDPFPCPSDDIIQRCKISSPCQKELLNVNHSTIIFILFF